ncbi:hypothetical protein BS47DRAFT_1393806 [Hydnum rufescens UP504]|uniref:Peptidase A2 domain-containing protein n=1 Tax=Hydnum rufescens UP504 TaxID=1448309 RepID=A0A9P6AVV9_9AGAM|nr:hypothetical protein BS47DRAFT_1393806 [Hydnum rufescens UP504]
MAYVRDRACGFRELVGVTWEIPATALDALCRLDSQGECFQFFNITDVGLNPNSDNLIRLSIRIAHITAATEMPQHHRRKDKLVNGVLERNTARPKDISRVLPNSMVVKVAINGHTCRALIDTGSLADFISTTCADQLKLPVENLVNPLPVQLAVTGSRSLIHHETRVLFELQGIRIQRRFDIMNLDSYDIVLGTPFLYQHSVTLGFNPSRFVIGNTDPLPLRGQDISVIPSRSSLIRKGGNSKRYLHTSGI